MSSVEFYSLLPVEFYALVAAWAKRERRLDIRVALLRLTVAQAMGAKAVTGQDLKLSDFLPSDKPQEPETTEELERQFIAALPSKWRPTQ